MIFVIKHVPQEGPGTIAEFFSDIKIIEFSKGEVLPTGISDVEAVFSMGGPMSANDESLEDERKFIRLLVEKEIPFFGVCLGAQLLAKACGAKVYKAPVKEIGWHRVSLMDDPLFNGLPKEIDVLQWHEDTFDIPSNGALIATGTDVRNQALRVGRCAYGLQFHIEVTPQMLANWFSQCSRSDLEHLDRLKGYANIVYKNFLGLCAQKLGNQKLYRRVIDSVEKKLIESVLQKTEGNQIQAAEILGINRNTLRTKIRKLGIEVNR